MSIIGVIAVIFIFYLIGILIVSLINIRKYLNFFESIALAYLVGSGVIILQMFLYSIFEFHWTRENLLMPWVILSFIFLYKNRVPRAIPSLILPKKLLPRILLALIFISVFFVIIEAVIRPISAWDVWTSWYMGGKAFFIDREIKPEFYRYVNYDYPPAMQLIIAFCSLFIGKFNDTSSLLLFTAFYISLLVGFYGFIRRHLSQMLSLFFTFLLASTQNILRQGGRYEAGHADLPLAVYFFMSSVLLVLYSRHSSKKILLLLQLLLFVSVFIKYEGTIFALIVNSILLFFIIVRKNFYHIPYLVISAVSIATWEMFKSTHNVVDSYLNQGGLQLERIPIVIQEVILELVNISRWNLLWITFIFIFFFALKNKKTHLLMLIFFLQFTTYFFAYVYTPLDYVLQLRSSLDRLLIQLAPIAATIIALVTSDIIQRSKLKTIRKLNND